MSLAIEAVEYLDASCSFVHIYIALTVSTLISYVYLLSLLPSNRASIGEITNPNLNITGAASTLVGGNSGEVSGARSGAQDSSRGNTCETSLSTAPRQEAQTNVGSSSNSSIGGSTQTLSGTHSSSTLHGESGVQTASFNSEPVSLDSVASMGIIANTSGTERSRDLALCAVLLDEWLKELAAIALEQSVVLVTEQLL